MKKNIIIFAAFLIAGIAMYRCHQLSSELADTRHTTPIPSSTHEMYQLWIDNGFYELRDGNRIVWKDKVGSGSDIDHLITEDNL